MLHQKHCKSRTKARTRKLNKQYIQQPTTFKNYYHTSKKIKNNGDEVDSADTPSISSPSIDPVLQDIPAPTTSNFKEWLHENAEKLTPKEPKIENINRDDTDDDNDDANVASDNNPDTDPTPLTPQQWRQMQDTPLYPNSPISTLEAVLLVHQYMINSNLNKTSSEDLLKLIIGLLPDGCTLPPSYYKLMKVCECSCMYVYTYITRSFTPTVMLQNTSIVLNVGTFSKRMTVQGIAHSLTVAHHVQQEQRNSHTFFSLI
jgi:hypothetical protein